MYALTSLGITVHRVVDASGSVQPTNRAKRKGAARSAGLCVMPTQDISRGTTTTLIRADKLCGRKLGKIPAFDRELENFLDSGEGAPARHSFVSAMNDCLQQQTIELLLRLRLLGLLKLR
jgi:hypothetical protein